MRAMYRVTFHDDGRPIHVRRDRIILISQGVRALQREDGSNEEQDITLVLIDGAGPVAVDESVEQAVSIWDDNLFNREPRTVVSQ